MGGINQHTILGNVGKIETRYTPDGKAIVNLSLAVSEKWTDKNTGQKQEKTEWLNVAVFGKPAEIISKYVQKGDKLFVQGQVKTRKWQDSNGNDRYSTETIVDGFKGAFELLGSKTGAPQQAQQPQQTAPISQSNQFQKPAAGQPFEGELDDPDIPF